MKELEDKTFSDRMKVIYGQLVAECIKQEAKFEHAGKCRFSQSSFALVYITCKYLAVDGVCEYEK